MWSRKELIDKQARFWVLMAQGSSAAGGVDAVGVDQRTGRHWRQSDRRPGSRSRPNPRSAPELGGAIGRIANCSWPTPGSGRSPGTSGGRPRCRSVANCAGTGPGRAREGEVGTHRMPRAEADQLRGRRPVKANRERRAGGRWAGQAGGSGAQSRSATTSPSCAAMQCAQRDRSGAACRGPWSSAR